MNRTGVFRPVALFLVALSCFLPARIAVADPVPPAEWSSVPDTVRFRTGWMVADFSTEAKVGVEDGSRGTNLNLEDIFNLPVSKGSFRLEGNWRFARKHHLDFGYIQFDRTAAREIDRQFDFGDTTYLANARVEATFDSRFIYAAYRYDFVRAQRVRFSGTAGLSYLTMSVGLMSDSNITGSGGSGSGSREQEASYSIPVPLFGLAIEGDITKTIVGWGYVRGLALSVSGINGRYVESGVGVDWYFLPHFGMGAAFDLTSITIEGTSDRDLEADFVYRFSGPRIYFSFAF